MDKNDEKFFYEDEVAMVSQKTGLVKYGLVLSTHPQWQSHGNSKKKKLCQSPYDIKIVWHPNGKEEIVPDNKLVLMDRSLMPGDVVRKVSEGTFSQFGYCENIDIYATVKILNTNKIIENVNTRNLTPTQPFAIDSSVFYESSVGKVYDVKLKVTFVSQDGSIFTLEDPYRPDFLQLSNSVSFSIDENVFYHGQKLKMCLDSLENAKFIVISKLMNCLYYNYKKKNNSTFGSKWIKVYVKDISVVSVEVEWSCQTSSKMKSLDKNWPERIIFGDSLKKLKNIDLFESCSIQLGDAHWYKIKDTDKLMTVKQWRNKCTEAFITGSGSGSPSSNKKDKSVNKLQNTKRLSKSTINYFRLGNLDNPIQSVLAVPMQRIVCNDITKFSLVTKKSVYKPTTSTGNNSKHTMKSNRLIRNRMWKSLVKKSKRFNVPKVTTKSDSKVVVQICYTKSIVDVIWQDGTKEAGVFSTDLYPVQTLDDLEFFPGDFVTEKDPPTDIYGVIESVDHVERTARVQWFRVFPENPSLPNLIEKTDLSVYDLRDHPDFHFKSGILIIHISPDTNPDLNNLTVGQVINAGPDGRILVMWVNGEKTECWPQELFAVKLYDDEDGFSYQDEDYDDDGDDDDDPSHISIHNSSSEDWTSGPESFNKSMDQENNEKFQKIQKLVVQSLRQADTCMKSFIDDVEHRGGGEWIIDHMIVKLTKFSEHIRSSLRFNSFLPNFKIQEYTDLMDNVAKMVERNILKLKNKKGTEEDDLECNAKAKTNKVIAQVKDMIAELSKFMADIKDKINQFSKEPCTNSHNIVSTSKHCKKEDQNEKNDSVFYHFETDTVGVSEPKPSLTTTVKEIRERGIQSIYECRNAEIECELIAKPEEAGVFCMAETLPNSHSFFNTKDNLQPSFLKIVTRDVQILQKSLPVGIWVKTFESRLDLFCIMIRGPEKTPYAGGLFTFDVKLPNTYPFEPPICHYYSYCDDRLNPNLYEDGKVCLSLLGTWSGNGVELWSPRESNLLQLLVSIQGLILVNEPYYNEAGFESQRGKQLAKENSRVYNEMVLIKVVQSMTNLIVTNSMKTQSTVHFSEEITEHVKYHGPKLINTIENWIKMSERELTEEEKLAPGFPLLPLSKGFCLSIKTALNRYKEKLISMNIMFK